MRKILVISILAVLIGNKIIAQVSNETVPFSWNFPPDQSGIIWQHLSSIEPTGLLAEDNLVSKAEPMRFAKSRTVNYNHSSHGRWTNLSNGDRIWKLGIKCNSSFSVGLLFSEFSIPQGSRVYIYSEDQTQHIGPFTSSDNRQLNEELVTPPIYGEKLVIEYYEPFAFRGQGNFHIKSVQHGYRDLFSYINTETNGDCIEILDNELSNISSSVLMMIVDGGQKIATGTIINNTAANSKPYLLTSINAMKGKPEGWVFLFDVTSEECGAGYNCWSAAVCGAQPVSVDSINGTALVSLRNAPPGNWSVYYSGWSTQINDAPGGYRSIQHANGMVQSLATYNGQLETVSWQGYEAKKIQGWNSGGTSSASIGSPLFDSSNNLIGIYVGGDLNCAGQGADYFASLSLSFPLFNSYLDPIRSGLSALGGVYPVAQEIQSHDSAFDVFFFPNPARGWIYTQVVSQEIQTLDEINIFDAHGKLIKTVFPQTPTIDLQSLPEGLYVIQFFSGAHVSTQKLLIR